MSDGRIMVGHPVDVGSGAVFTLSTDFRIPGALGLRWRRHYSTVSACDTWVGVKWSLPYFMSLEKCSDGYVLTGAHGEEITFTAVRGSLRRGEVLTNLSANMELRRDPEHYTVVHWHSGGDVSRFCFPAKDDQRLRLAWIENLAGHRVAVTYDLAGRPTGLFQELERRTVEITYHRDDLIDAVYFLGMTGRRLLVRYEYDSLRRLITAVNAMGYRKGYTYDKENRLIAETNPLGSRFEFVYDRFGRCTRTAGADGFQERKLQYLTAPRVTRVTDSRGAVTQYFLNPSGQVVQIVDALGGVTTNSFDERGRLVGVLHPDGAKESSAYDEQGNRATTVDRCGAKTVVDHDEFHAPTRLVDRNGNAWKLERPHEGSLFGLENLPRRMWKYQWGSNGLVTEARSAGNWVFHIRRDEHFRWQENHDQIALVSRTEFDELGYPILVLDSSGVVSKTGYDDLHRPVEITRGPLGRTRFEWNAIGQMTKRTRPGRSSETWCYDQYGHLLIQTNATGGTVSYEYDHEGKMAAITNRVGERFEYHRDLQGRIVKEKLFDGRLQSYEYDPSGRRAKIFLSDGRTVVQRFDLAGRVVAREASDGLVEEFAYDHEGRVIKAWNNHTVVELARDRFGRIVLEHQHGRRLSYRYDADGNRVGRLLPFSDAGSRVTRTFDARGRLLELWDERGLCQKLQWDNLDRVVERRCPGGVVEYFSYDNDRHLHEQRVQARDGRFVRIYSYDLRGNLIVLQDNRQGTIRFSYDELDRLREVQPDQSGAIAEEAYDYDANDAICASHHGPRDVAAGAKVLRDGSREMSYGEDGAVKVIRTGPFHRTLKHDVNGRLVDVVQPDGSVVHYEYDPFGRRTAKLIDGERMEFLWEGHALAAEVQGGAPLNVYVSMDLRPVAQWHRGRRVTPILDGRGAVQNTFDEFGEPRWACTLDAYGNLLSGQGDLPNPFRLRGQYHDVETGLYYNFHRHYDPAVGDYTAPDPIGVAGGNNFYAYPRNPLRWDDPFGLECDDPEKHKDDPPPEEDPDNPKPTKGPPALADPPEEPPPGTPSPKDILGKPPNPKSKPQFGHTFETHGEGSKTTANLQGRAAGTGDPQGQWLDNQQAADVLSQHYPLSGPKQIDIPPGLGQVINPDGTTDPNVTRAQVVPKRDGTIRSAFPISTPAPAPDPTPAPEANAAPAPESK
ncbi:MAG TPA: RHS repeat-associated core domain-containing protein [Chthoniobacterales bacterium]